jgi:hypothetical protein
LRGGDISLTVVGENLLGMHVEIGGRRARIKTQTQTEIKLDGLPAGLTAGVQILVAASAEGGRSNSLQIVLLPRIRSSKAVPPRAGLGERTLVVSVEPVPAPAERLMLLLNARQGQAGFELGPALQFRLPAEVREINASNPLPPALRDAFRDAGLPLSQQVTLEPLAGGTIRMTDPLQGHICLLRDESTWWVRYGLSADFDASSIAFGLPNPLPGPAGDYLLRLRLLQEPPVDSLLTRSGPAAPYEAPSVSIPPERAG